MFSLFALSVCLHIIINQGLTLRKSLFGSGQIFRYFLYTSIALAFLGIGSAYISCLLGFAYPAFMPVLALESGNKSDDKQWLTYWIIFGVLSFAD